MRRIDELSDIDLYDAEGVFKYLKELTGIHRDLAVEVEYSSEALRIALGTVGGLLGNMAVETRMRAKRTTAPLRRVAEAGAFSSIQVVKAAQLFKVNYSEEHEKAGRQPTKKFNF